MTKYIKKPVEIEAVQLTNYNIIDVYEFIRSPEKVSFATSEDVIKWSKYEIHVKKRGMRLETLEGAMLAQIGDYVIKGIKGEFYPCKQEIFDLTYSELD